MSKPGLPKKKRGPSIHSRAARRGTSPVTTDKTLNDVPGPRERAPAQPSVLAARQGAGVSKKTTRKAVASARARRRRERGVDMAEAVSEKTSLKVERSARQARTLKGRRKTWDEVNTGLGEGADKGPGSGGNAFAALGEESEEEEGGDDAEDAPLRAVVPQMVYEGGDAEGDEEIL